MKDPPGTHYHHAHIIFHLTYLSQFIQSTIITTGEVIEVKKKTYVFLMFYQDIC